MQFVWEFKVTPVRQERSQVTEMMMVIQVQHDQFNSFLNQSLKTCCDSVNNVRLTQATMIRWLESVPNDDLIMKKKISLVNVNLSVADLKMSIWGHNHTSNFTWFITGRGPPCKTCSTFIRGS